MQRSKELPGNKQFMYGGLFLVAHLTKLRCLQPLVCSRTMPLLEPQKGTKLKFGEAEQQVEAL